MQCVRAMFGSSSCDVHLTKMRSVPLIRCLPKMSPSSSSSTGSQIATWRRSLTWTRHDFNHISDHRWRVKMFVWSPALLSEPGSARYSSAPSITTVWSSYQTSYNDFFEVYHRNGDFIIIYSKWSILTSSTFSINKRHVTNRFSSSLVKSPSADIPLSKIISM